MPRSIDLYQGPSSIDLDAEVPVPEREFSQMGSRVVPARNEGCLLILDRLKGLRNIRHALDTGGIAFRSNQHKVVVHHRTSFHAMSFGDELLLRTPSMYKHNISAAAPSRVERLAGAHCHHVHGNAGLQREER